MLVALTALAGASIFLILMMIDRRLKDKEKRERFGSLGQWAAGCIVGAALGYEIAAKAEMGLVAMTLGSILFAAFTKIRRG